MPDIRTSPSITPVPAGGDSSASPSRGSATEGAALDFGRTDGVHLGGREAPLYDNAGGVGESDAFQVYLAEMSRYRLLPHHEIVDLARVMAESKAKMTTCLARIPSASRQALRLCEEAVENGIPLSQLLDTGASVPPDEETKRRREQRRQGVESERQQLLNRIDGLQRSVLRWEDCSNKASLAALSHAFVDLSPNIHLLRKVAAYCQGIAVRLAPERAVGAAQVLRQLELAAGADRQTLNAACDHASQAEKQYAGAWKRMVQANLRLVIAVARRFSGGRVPLEDLIQEGNVGLFRAVEKFDYRLGYRFSTYASFWIRQAVTKALVNHGRTLRVPAHMNDKIVKLHNLRATLHQTLGRPASTTELAEHSKLPLETVRVALQSAQTTLSLDSPVAEDDGGTFHDTTPDHSSQPVEDVGYASELRGLMATLLDRLPPREGLILKLRHGIGDMEPMTLDQIAKVIGVSRERVRQLETRANVTIRGHIESELTGLEQTE